MISKTTENIIDDYIKVTGRGEGLKFSLSPEDYLRFRREAIEEISNGYYANRPPQPTIQTAPFFTTPVVADENRSDISHPAAVEMTPTNVLSKTQKPEDKEEEQDDLLARMKGVPG